MSKTAFLFPGQGSQTSGMGRRFYDDWPEFRAAFDRLNETVPWDLETLIFEGPSSRLRQTQYTQPAVLAVGSATAMAVEERYGYRPDIVTGHSLGHFTALVSAEGLDGKRAVELVTERGRLMQRAGEENGPGTMVAALFVDPEDVADVCEQYPEVTVGVYNGPRQTVISGATEQVEQVQQTLEAEHRVRFQELDVGTAFHSPLMRSAVDPFEDVLETTEFHPPTIPVVSDVSTATYVDASVARRDLATQLTSPVQWTGVVETLADENVTRYVEFPPSGTLGSIVQRMEVDGDVYELDSPDAAEEVFTDVR